LHRLISPIEIGSSFKKISPIISKDEIGIKECFQGEQETSLFVWRDNSGDLIAWQIENEQNYTSWKEGKEIETGTVLVSEQVIGMSEPWKKSFQSDASAIQNQVQLAIDIMMAFQNEDQTDILNTLIG
jgi:hypothetical protein